MNVPSRKLGRQTALTLLMAFVAGVTIGSTCVARSRSNGVPPGFPTNITRDVTQYDIASRHSGRTYRVRVYRPSMPPPAQGYPVIYFTDGDLTFNTAVDQMHSRFLVDLTPAVVVGIGYPNDNLWDVIRLRLRDFLPWKPSGAFAPMFAQWSKFGGATEADSGGAEVFFKFLTEELRPRLASEMTLDGKNQALYGHSLGGLFTLYTLFEHPTAFSTYIVSSPSILVNERHIRRALPGFKAEVEAGRIAPRILFLTGGQENGLPPSALAALPEKDRLSWTVLGVSPSANTIEIADDLAEYRGASGYEVRKHVFDGENHNSVVPASIARALTFAFSTLPARMRN